MGKTQLSKKGTSLSRLTDKERKFVCEYLVDYNATRAAEAAGYSKKTAQVQGSKILKRPKIAALIGKMEREDVKQLELDRHATLQQLYYALTRRIGDFVDDQGRVKEPHELPEHLQSVVDGFEKTVVENPETGTVTTKTKYKLTPHAAAREQALKHKGLFEPERHQHQHLHLNWDDLAGQPEHDPVEQAILEVEQE